MCIYNSIYTPKLGSAIAPLDREGERGRFGGSTEGARESIGKVGREELFGLAVLKKRSPCFSWSRALEALPMTSLLR